jgi:hypothetical protein
MMSFDSTQTSFMKEYLLLFRNASAPDGYFATTEDMAQDLPHWQAWIKDCLILKYPHSSVEIRPLVPFPTN